MNDPKDDIAAWAESLTPEGSPGLLSEALRQYLGDQGYEEAKRRNDIEQELHTQRQQIINRLLWIALVYGVAGLVIVPAVLLLVLIT